MAASRFYKTAFLLPSLLPLVSSNQSIQQRASSTEWLTTICWGFVTEPPVRQPNSLSSAAEQQGRRSIHRGRVTIRIGKARQSTNRKQDLQYLLCLTAILRVIRKCIQSASFIAISAEMLHP